MFTSKDSSTETVFNYGQKTMKMIQFISLDLLLILIFIPLTGCTTILGNDATESDSLTPVAPIVEVTSTVLIETSTAVPIAPRPTATVAATSTPTVTVSLTASNNLNEREFTTATSEPQVTRIQPLDWRNEQLITLRTDGIYRITLGTEESERIIATQDNWQLFDAKISANGKQAIYWFIEDDTYQVWVIDTTSGETNLLLSIMDSHFTGANGAWYGQDNFFELGIRGEDENGVPLVVQWYLIDLPQGEVVGAADDRPGTNICHTLAVSPRSDVVATWCSFDSQFDEQNEYFVIESDGETWRTEIQPARVLMMTSELGKQIWSLNGEYILIPGSSNATLIYVPEARVYTLFENDDIYINTHIAKFSPDNRFLSYGYDACQDGASETTICLRVIELSSREVIWESAELYTAPVFIAGWSPNSEFFILSTFEEGDLLFRASDFSIVKSFSATLITTIETAWLNN